MTGNGKFRKMSVWAGLCTLALLGGTVGWSRSTSHLAAPEPQAAPASESQSAATHRSVEIRKRFIP